MSTTQLEAELKRECRIDVIRKAYRIVKLRERKAILDELAEDAQELNFDDEGVH